MSDIGLRRGTVKLEYFDDSWADIYRAEKQRILNTLGNVTIEHVGSTAIPGIKAKPIIDVAIPVTAVERVDEWIKQLKLIGYWDKGKQQDMPERRFLAKGPESNRSVYLHIVTPPEFERMIAFRNALLDNLDLRNQYSKLKEDLAAKFPDDRGSYSKGKEQFIQSVLSGNKF